MSCKKYVQYIIRILLTISAKDPYTGYVVLSCHSSVLFYSEKVKKGRSTGVDQKVDNIKVTWNDYEKDTGCIENPGKQVKLNSNKITNLPSFSARFTQATHLRILCSPKIVNLDVSHGHKDHVAVEADIIEESEGMEVRYKPNLVVEMFCIFWENVIFSKTILFIRYRIWNATHDLISYTLLLILFEILSLINLMFYSKSRFWKWKICPFAEEVTIYKIIQRWISVSEWADIPPPSHFFYFKSS